MRLWSRKATCVFWMAVDFCLICALLAIQTSYWETTRTNTKLFALAVVLFALWQMVYWVDELVREHKREVYEWAAEVMADHVHQALEVSVDTCYALFEQTERLRLAVLRRLLTNCMLVFSSGWLLYRWARKGRT